MQSELLLKLRDCILNKEIIVANMRMENEHRDGWSCNWNEALRVINNEIDIMWKELK